MVSFPSRADLCYGLFPVSSCQGGVLSRRPVAERRHFGRVLCGLTCPLCYAPSESVAAGITHRLDSGLPETTELYSHIFSQIKNPVEHLQRFKQFSLRLLKLLNL